MKIFQSNLDAELIQCDISFGFEKKPESEVTSKHVDSALEKEISMLKKKINFLSFNLFLRRLKLQRLKVVSDSNMSNVKALGFSNFALIINFKGFYLSDLYLIIKGYNESEKEIMIEAIVKISKEYNLFLVDYTMNSVVDSKYRLYLDQYLIYDY